MMPVHQNKRAQRESPGAKEASPLKASPRTRRGFTFEGLPSRKRMGCDQNCGLLAAAIIGAIVAVLGGALIPVGNYFIEKAIKKERIIEKGTIAYENWIVPGSAVYRQFWIFNVENPSAVMENGSRPILKQRGPYTYRVRFLPKQNITENPDSTLSYFLPNIARFEPALSIGPENDTFTVVNLALVTAPVLYPNNFVHVLLNVWMKSSKSFLLQNRTVNELLWGYEDPFLKKVPFPTDKKVGIFLPYNETLDGLYTVYSGKDNIYKTALIQSYKNKSTLSFWEGSCDMVNGTDGASFPPFVRRDDVLRFFSSDICRSFYGEFDSDQVVKGIPLYRFIVPPGAFASPLINPENLCFCLEKVISMNCTIAGALDISTCKQGKPVVITLPHLLYASEEIREGVEGMNPNKEEHMTYLDIEPTTGFTLQFASRLQINLVVRPAPKIMALQKVKIPFLFPILWLNETAIIDDRNAEFFRSKVTNKIKLLQLLEAVLIVFGAVIFLGFLVSYLICSTQKVK